MFRVSISGRRRSGLTLLEVVVASVLLAIIIVSVLAMTGATQTAIYDLDRSEAAANSAKAALEAFETAPWNSSQGTPCMHNFYHAFRRADPAFVPKVSSLFDVLGPGMVAGNKYGSVVVREPTAAEAPRYNKGTGPRFPYVTPTDPYVGVSSALSGTPGGNGLTTTNEPKVYLIIVEVNVPANGVAPPIRIRLQSWRFAL